MVSLGFEGGCGQGEGGLLLGYGGDGLLLLLLLGATKVLNFVDCDRLSLGMGGEGRDGIMRAARVWVGSNRRPQ